MAKVDLTDAEKIRRSEGSPGQAFSETLEEYYPPLRSYVSDAKRNGDCLLVWVI